MKTNPKVEWRRNHGQEWNPYFRHQLYGYLNGRSILHCAKHGKRWGAYYKHKMDTSFGNACEKDFKDETVTYPKLKDAVRAAENFFRDNPEYIMPWEGYQNAGVKNENRQ